MQNLTIVGIGASAGGLETIKQMVANADADQHVAYVVVQHLDPNHESMMAELLAPHTDLAVKQAEDGESVEPGTLYVIPPGYGLSVSENSLNLHKFTEPRGLRRPIDDFFESLAENYKDHSICVILSGTGADGTSGLRAIKEQGGICIVQDPETAKYDGMPLSAVSTGLVDFVKPPEDIVATIRGYLEQQAKDTEAAEAADLITIHIDDICSTLSAVVGHDFGGYKRSTITRRIQRRMQVLGLTDGADYLKHIREDDDECQTLLREFLINVTRFFRDPEQFEQMRETAIRPLVAKNKGDEIRVWVAGCSSGEEAYSIAMCFADEFRRAKKSGLLQIFATDIDEKMLATARAGIYPTASLLDIPEDLRENYTVGRDGSFQIAPAIRDMVRFSSHNLIKDPPFSRLDLISCRNVLIYFGDRLQAQALPIFHYSLKPGSYLFLGPSESIGRYDDLFTVQDQKARLYRRNDGRPVYPLELTSSSRTRNTPTDYSVGRSGSGNNEWDDTYATERILERYAPPSLRINPDGEILRSAGQFAQFLELSPTRSGPSFIQHIARRGLREVLSTLIHQVGVDQRRKVVRGVEVFSDFGSQTIDVYADPLPDKTLLLVFKTREQFRAVSDEDLDEVREFDSHQQIIEDELRITRLRLRSAVEELETANEELKSSNEEMMSMNEELQSTNEELSTVNDELKSKVDQLTVANADLVNLFDSINLPLIVVDGDLVVRKFSDRSHSIFDLREGDEGRNLSTFRPKLEDCDNITDLVRAVMKTGRSFEEKYVGIDTDRVWAASITPYITKEGFVDGAVLAFADVTNAMELEDALLAETERLKLALDVARIGFWEYQYESGKTVLDDGARRLFDVDLKESQEAENLFDRILDEDREMVDRAVADAIEERSDYEADFRIRRRDGGIRYLKGLGRKIRTGRTESLIGVNFDRTADAESSILRETMIREMNHRIKNQFSVMSALIRLGARTTENAKELAMLLDDRIIALSRSHDLSLSRNSQSVSLREALSVSLDPYLASGHATLSGEDIQISPDYLTPLALIMHEWTTNSAKHGALGAEDGKLDVSWHSEADDRVHLVWCETATRIAGDHEIEDGFGTKLIGVSLVQIDGSLDHVREDGRWQMELAFKNEPD